MAKGKSGPDIVWSKDDGGRQPERRAMAEEAISKAVAVFRDPTMMSLLPGPFLFVFLERDLPVIAGEAAKYARTRLEQSGSKAKHDRGSK